MGETTSIILPPKGTVIHINWGRGEVWGRMRSTQNVLQSPLRYEGIFVDDLCANHCCLLSSASVICSQGEKCVPADVELVPNHGRPEQFDGDAWVPGPLVICH